MFRCTTDKYDALYARWLVRPGELLDLAGWEPGQRLLDLCGGTGAVALEAVRRGANPRDITLLDLNPRCPDKGVRQVRGRAEALGFALEGEEGRYDVVVCRQAIAYVRVDRIFAESLHRLLKPDGRFTFNTFVRPRWSWRTYHHRHASYLEASGYFGRRVFHLQASPMHGADFTLFRWHSERDLTSALAVSFDVHVRHTERSLRFLCARRRRIRYP